MSRENRLLAIALGVCASMPFEVGAVPGINKGTQKRSYSVMRNKKPQQQKNKVKARVGTKQPQVSNKNGKQLKLLKNREGLAINKRQPKKVAVPVPKKEDIKVLNSREISVRTSNGKFTKGEIALVSVGGVAGLALIIGGVYVAVRRYKDGKWFWEKVATEKSKLVLEGNQIKYNYGNGEGSATISFNLNSTTSYDKNKVINVKNNNMPCPSLNNFNYETDDKNNNDFGISIFGASYNNQNDVMSSMSNFKKIDEDIIIQNGPGINMMENNNVNEVVMQPNNFNDTGAKNGIVDNIAYNDPLVSVNYNDPPISDDYIAPDKTVDYNGD